MENRQILYGEYNRGLLRWNPFNPSSDLIKTGSTGLRMNGLRIIRMEPSDNIGLNGYYTDDRIDRIDQIIWSFFFDFDVFFFLKKKLTSFSLGRHLNFGVRLERLERLEFRKVSAVLFILLS